LINTYLEPKGMKYLLCTKQTMKITTKKMKHCLMESKSIKIECSAVNSFHKWILVTNLN